ncbi:26S proteasome non-ATPase regulatory subunit 10-like isoform X2 [Haliotis rufescens]|uniref:26S proteasome non-ATPase regulatory subunit 10-like isoform X2 n=1 Tax=Haliotis rufescens TaxID=6454 RepID=UPI00201F7C24|nr:26S proteasome non-ATPase regulatory subunit 10-like isoform X2 [Haliotis rufescens]
MLLVCSSNCCILQLALTATVYLMFGLSTCHTKTCGLQISGEMKNRSVTLRNVDIKLCKVRCMKNSLIFASCHQSTGESKKTEKIGGSTNQPSVSSKHCTAKVCNLTRPSLEIGSGKAVRVQATPTASPRLQPADAKLHSACLSGDLSAVRRILSVGQADINCRKNGRTPVMTAAVKEFREVVLLLVSNGADVSLVDNNGNNILHMVCLQRDLEALKYVLSQDMVGINDRGWFERTSVMRAAEKGYKEVVELLVHKGADVTLVDKHGDNILHLACQKNNVEMVKYVLSQDMVDVDARNNKGQNAVTIVKSLKRLDVLDLLVSRGAHAQ